MKKIFLSSVIVILVGIVYTFYVYFIFYFQEESFKWEYLLNGLLNGVYFKYIVDFNYSNNECKSQKSLC